MNKTKKILIIFAIFFSFLDMAWAIYDIVSYFKLEPQYRDPVFYLIYTFIELFASLAVVVLLTLSIWKNGKLFRQRYGMYMSALVISIILNLFSIASILLIITMFVSDWVWIKPEKTADEKIVEVKPEDKESKISCLREKHDKGEISDEEYREELTKLL